MTPRRYPRAGWQASTRWRRRRGRLFLGMGSAPPPRTAGPPHPDKSRRLEREPLAKLKPTSCAVEARSERAGQPHRPSERARATSESSQSPRRVRRARRSGGRPPIARGEQTFSDRRSASNRGARGAVCPSQSSRLSRPRIAAMLIRRILVEVSHHRRFGWSHNYRNRRAIPSPREIWNLTYHRGYTLYHG